MTLIDLFRQFHLAAIVNGFTVSAKIAYQDLLWVWNERGRPDSITLASSYVYELTGLPRQTAADALKYLASRNLINYTRKGRQLRISFKPPTEWQVDGASPALTRARKSSEKEKERVSPPAHEEAAVSAKTERNVTVNIFDGCNSLEEMLRLHRATKAGAQSS